MERFFEAAQGGWMCLSMLDAIPAEYQFGELDWLVETVLSDFDSWRAVSWSLVLSIYYLAD